MEDVSLSNMRVKHIETMVVVTIEFTLGEDFVYTPKNIKETFGGPIKTRKELINGGAAANRATVRGYVCTQTQHSDSEVRKYVKNAMHDAVKTRDDYLKKIDINVLVGERYDIKNRTGNEVLSKL